MKENIKGILLLGFGMGVVFAINYLGFRHEQQAVFEATGCKVGLAEIAGWGRWSAPSKIAEIIKKGCP